MAGLALAGTVTCQAKAHAPGAGLGGLLLYGTATTQAKAFSGPTTPGVTALIGHCTTALHGRVGPSKKAALAGTVTMQAKMSGPFSGVPFPIYFDVATLMRDTPVAAVGAMDDDDVDDFGVVP